MNVKKIRRAKMDKNNRAHSTGSGQEGKFFNGFLLGLVVGALVVFFLGTKKGKKIWKAITEKGIDNFSNLLDEAEKNVDLDEVVEKVSETKPGRQKEEFLQKREFAVKERFIEERPKVRRFFRGISRHAN